MTLLYIDPQSSDNMALYDYCLLENINAEEIVYCCNKVYNAPKSQKIVYKSVFNHLKYKNKIFKGIAYLYALLKVMVIAKKMRPDVVHIQWWRIWIIDYFFLKLFKRYANEVVFTAHNVVPHNSGDTMMEKCTKYYKRVDKIIVHVQRTKDELIESFGIDGSKIYVIPHGVLDTDLDKGKVDNEISNLRKQYELDGKMIISALGTQSPYKGTDIIREAYISSSMLQHSKGVVFIVSGKGEYFKKEMMNDYQNIIIFDEIVSSERFEALMQLSDVLLLPYRKISQSGVLLTAIAKEIPYIATDVGGLTEPFNVANIGWMLNECSSGELQKLLEYLAENPQEVISKKSDTIGWNNVKAQYDWKVIGEKTMQCYKE